MSETPLPIQPQTVAPAWNEASIERALLDAQADLFVAAQLLGHVTVQKLDRAIRSSDRLQRIFLAIREVKSLPEYDKASTKQLETEIQRRLTIYKADALEAMHELATMTIGDNSAMAQVKLAAAARLTGPMGNDGGASEIEKTLRDLNELYHAEAPKITMTRTEIEFSRRPPEREIEGQVIPVPEDPRQTP